MSTPLAQQSSRDRIRERQARLAEASSLAARGEVDAAVRIVEAVLTEDPHYGPAHALLDRLTVSPAAAAEASPRAEPGPASDARPQAAPATLPGTNVSTGSWAQFQRRMQLRRETTCLTVLRRAMDAHDYRTALDRANELVAIDPEWGEVKGFLEDLVASESRPPAEVAKAPVPEPMQAVPPPATQVARAVAPPRRKRQPAASQPLAGAPLATAAAVQAVATPQPAPAVPSTTVAVAGRAETRIARRRVLLPTAIALVLAMAALAGWSIARLLPLDTVWDSIEGPSMPGKAQHAPAPVAQSPAGDASAAADSPPLPLAGVVPPLPNPPPGAGNSANENDVSQNRNAVGDTLADPTGTDSQSKGATATHQLNVEPPGVGSSSPANGMSASTAKPPAIKPSASLPERSADTGRTSAATDPAPLTTVPPAAQQGTRDANADTPRRWTNDTRPTQSGDTVKTPTPPNSEPATPTTSQPRYEAVSPPAAPPVSSPSSSAAPPPVSPPPAATATDSRPAPATETGRETVAPTVGTGSADGARGTTGTAEAAEREREREYEATEERAINRTLGAYAQGYMSLNATAVRRVWPSVNEEALRTAFGQLQSQRIAFNDCTIDIRGLHAAATCTGSATYVPKVGNSRQLSVSHRWQFALRKVVETWLIEAATIK